MIPSVGRIVHYTLTADDAEQANRRRKDARNNIAKHREDRLGYVAHFGNDAAEGQVYPALIVRVWGEQPTEQVSVNLQVFLDGNDVLWVTSAGQGDGLRQWHEPPRI